MEGLKIEMKFLIVYQQTIHQTNLELDSFLEQLLRVCIYLRMDFQI